MIERSERSRPFWWRRPVAGHPLYLWIIWLGVFLGVLCSPMLSADPAVCFYLLDPELLVLMLIVGLQHSRLQLAILRLRIQDSLSRLRRPHPRRVGSG